MRFRERHLFKRRGSKQIEVSQATTPRATSSHAANSVHLDYACALEALSQFDLAPKELALAKRDLRNTAIRKILDTV